MKTLYYVVEKQLCEGQDGFEVTNGYSSVTVYEIEDNKPQNLFEIDVKNGDNVDEEIQSYLNNEGYPDFAFNTQQL